MNNLAISTYVGDLIVEHTSTVNISKKFPLKIEIHSLEILFEFIDDDDIIGSDIKFTSKNKQGTFKLINYKNAIGEGLDEPINIAEHGNKDIWLSFNIWTKNFDKGLYIVNYTIYTKDKPE